MKAKPIHGEPIPHNIPEDAQSTPPEPCNLAVGDVVTYTNDYGIRFKELVITGFTPEVTSWGASVYLAKDSWWNPVKASSLKVTA